MDVHENTESVLDMRRLKLLVETACIMIGSIAVTVFCMFYCLMTMKVLGQVITQRFSPKGASSWANDIYVLGAYLRSVQPMELLNLSHVAMTAVLLGLVALLTHIDVALTVVKKAIREKAKLPDPVVLNYFNGKSYDRAVAVSGASARIAKRL